MPQGTEEENNTYISSETVEGPMDWLNYSIAKDRKNISLQVWWRYGDALKQMGNKVVTYSPKNESAPILNTTNIRNFYNITGDEFPVNSDMVDRIFESAGVYASDAPSDIAVFAQKYDAQILFTNRDFLVWNEISTFYCYTKNPKTNDNVIHGCVQKLEPETISIALSKTKLKSGKTNSTVINLEHCADGKIRVTSNFGSKYCIQTQSTPNMSRYDFLVNLTPTLYGENGETMTGEIENLILENYSAMVFLVSYENESLAPSDFYKTNYYHAMDHYFSDGFVEGKLPGMVYSIYATSYVPDSLLKEFLYQLPESGIDSTPNTTENESNNITINLWS